MTTGNLSGGGVFETVVRRGAIMLRFLFPDRQTCRDARILRDSGQFDRAFYLRSNPRLRRLFRLAPERHYVLFGEPMGLCPDPSFSPRAYLHNNPDVTTGSAFVHFIQTGQHEGRVAFDATPTGDLTLPDITANDHPTPPARVAVVVHLFYHDLWEGFAETLTQQDIDFDLFVTITGTPDEVAPLRARIQSRFADARIWAMPNHGRDIFPFAYLVRSGVLSTYSAVCKLHGKRSPHRADGDQWRIDLVGGVMGDADQTRTRLDRFLDDPLLGLWVGDGHIMDGEDWWGMNRQRAAALMERGGLKMAPLRFPAGSIYWVKQPVIAAFERLDLDVADFEREQQRVDGTTAHAVERILGSLTTYAGLEMCTPKDLDA